jgi:hypothetical protein
MSDYKAIATLDNSAFLSGLSGMTGGMHGLIGKLAGLTAAFLGVRSVFQGFTAALEQGGQLHDLSVQTGVAVKDLVVLKQTFEDIGAGADGVGPAVQQMQRTLSGIGVMSKRGQSIMRQMGLDPEQLKTKDVQTQFMTIAEAIGRVSDPAQQTAAAIALFGESGNRLKELFANPEAIRKTAQAMGELPQQIQDSANRFDDLGDRMNMLKFRAQGIFVGALNGLAPAISQVMGMFERIDFAAIGAKLGKAIGVIVELFASGDITEAAGLALSIGFGKAINFLASTIGSITWWNGAVLIAIGAFAKLGAMLMTIFSEPLVYIEAGIEAIFQGIWANIAQLHPLLAQALGISNFKEQSFGTILAEKKKDGIFSQKSAKEVDAESMLVMKEGWNLMKGALANKKNLVDTTSDEAALTAILEKASKAATARAEATAPETPKAPTGAGITIDMPTGKQSTWKDISDQYAKIGLFIGGAGGGSIDYQRRTAGATEKSAKNLDTLVKNIGRSASPVAVWGGT